MFWNPLSILAGNLDKEPCLETSDDIHNLLVYPVQRAEFQVVNFPRASLWESWDTSFLTGDSTELMRA